MTEQTAATKPAELDEAKLWPRLAFMVVFAVMFAVAQNLLLLIAALQALWLGLSGAPNARIALFGEQLGAWLSAVARYQSCAAHERPFPWADWPAGRA